MSKHEPDLDLIAEQIHEAQQENKTMHTPTPWNKE